MNPKTLLLFIAAAVGAQADLHQYPIKKDSSDESSSFHQHLRGLADEDALVDSEEGAKINPTTIGQKHLIRSLRSPGASSALDTVGHRSVLSVSELDDNCPSFGQLRTNNGKCSDGKEYGQVRS